jgi:hypothetical protein
MCNGYALCHRTGLEAISAHLAKLGPDDLDALRAKLRIGVQTDVEVTDAPVDRRPFVSQAFCSALPVAYTQVAARYWRAFASLVLEAACEATMWSAVLSAERGVSNIALLTLLGGGAFGNDCPSSYDLEQIVWVRKGGSGSLVDEVMRTAADAASVDWRSSGA